MCKHGIWVYHILWRNAADDCMWSCLGYNTDTVLHCSTCSVPLRILCWLQLHVSAASSEYKTHFCLHWSIPGYCVLCGTLTDKVELGTSQNVISIFQGGEMRQQRRRGGCVEETPITFKKCKILWGVTPSPEKFNFFSMQLQHRRTEVESIICALYYRHKYWRYMNTFSMSPTDHEPEFCVWAVR